MVSVPIKCSKTYKVPRRPYEAERMDHELRLCGEYALRNKREIWRIGYMLSMIRRAARELLKLEPKHPRRLFEGNAIIRRLKRNGVLNEDVDNLDQVLSLDHNSFLDRRLQTIVFKQGLAKSMHHARVLIKQGHISVRSQIVNVPSFIVRLDSQKHVGFASKSPFGGGKPGRVARKRAQKAASGASGDNDEDDE